MKITETVLFARPVPGTIYGGRFSMSWWATETLPFIFIIFAAAEYVGYRHNLIYNNYNLGLGSYLSKNWHTTIGATLVFCIAYSWLFIPWRTQLPIIFNRRTRSITCIIDNKVVSKDWENIEFCLKDITSFSADGTIINEGSLDWSFLLVNLQTFRNLNI